jgi:transposase InsO family protein
LSRAAFCAALYTFGADMQTVHITRFNKLYQAAKHLNKAVDDNTAAYRLKVLDFYKTYGLKPSLAAFPISRSTLFGWQKLLVEHGARGLVPCSRKPLRSRQSAIPNSVVNFILNYRREHPRVCQYTIKPLLDNFCKKQKLSPISTSSIERIIRKLKTQGKMPANKHFTLWAREGKIRPKRQKHYKKLRRGKYNPKAPGDIVQIDSVHLVNNGVKKYLINAIDLKSRFAYSEVYGSLNSLSAKDFMQKLQQVTPFKIERIQTDNGSEFCKNFIEHVKEQVLIHYHNYPKCPKSNAYVERFNRTIREQFVQCTPYAPGSPDFKKELADYIIWYNTQRVHKGLKYITPLQYILSQPPAQIQNYQKSHMY